MTVIEREASRVEGPVTDVERRARVLEAAALEIEVRGHAHGWGENASGNVCLVGALALAQGRPTRDWEHADVEDPWWGDTPHHTDGLWQFNDCSTADEVTFLLRWRAAELRDGFDGPRAERAHQISVSG